MLAILIAADNWEKIAESGVFERLPVSDLSLLLNRRVEWYLITGYVPKRGPIIDFTILPKVALQDYYDYDADKIQTDFVNLVRKEEAP